MPQACAHALEAAEFEVVAPLADVAPTVGDSGVRLPCSGEEALQVRRALCCGSD